MMGKIVSESRFLDLENFHTVHSFSKLWTTQVLLGGRRDGTEKVISPWCIWEKCFQLLVLQQHISALMCGTYGLCHLLAKTAIVPCYVGLKEVFGDKTSYVCRKTFLWCYFYFASTQYFMKASTLRCHSQLLARYKEGLLSLIKMSSIYIKIYPELPLLSSLPRVVRYNGTSTFSGIFSTLCIP